MSFRELYDWYEFYNEEPFFCDRIEIQLATLSLMVNGFGGGKSKHSDFMIRKQEEKKQTLKEFEDDLKARFMPFAKNINWGVDYGNVIRWYTYKCKEWYFSVS